MHRRRPVIAIQDETDVMLYSILYLSGKEANKPQAGSKLASRIKIRKAVHVCGQVLSKQVRRRPQYLSGQVIVRCRPQAGSSGLHVEANC